jgi:hypothetical protein
MRATCVFSVMTGNTAPSRLFHSVLGSQLVAPTGAAAGPALAPVPHDDPAFLACIRLYSTHHILNKMSQCPDGSISTITTCAMPMDHTHQHAA